MDSVLPPPDGRRHERVEAPPHAGAGDDGPTIADDVTRSMHQLLDVVVGTVPGVVGAVVGSADGFALASRLPADGPADAASVAAMSGALLGLSNRLVEAVAPGRSRIAELRSEAAHGYVFAIAHAATLTILATPESERPQVMAVGREVSAGLLRLLRGTADV